MRLKLLNMQDLRLSYLKAMGVDIWVRRELPDSDSGYSDRSDTRTTSRLIENRDIDESLLQGGLGDEIPLPAPDMLAPERYDSVPSHPPESPPLEDIPDYVDSVAPRTQARGGVTEVDWSELQQRVAACTLCELHQSRTQTVFGVGNEQADIMLIGEAPGADEDRQGEPFVGKAGQLLNAMLKAIGLNREQVYIANVLKCRPPNNRDPRPEEAALCSAYLTRQIELLQPKLILALGRIAAQRLLESNSPLGRMRTQIHHLESTGTPVMVTYHPAYLLRSPAEKRKAWEDLCKARDFVANVHKSGRRQ